VSTKNREKPGRGGRRGGGGHLPPWRYFGSPGRLLPPETCILSHFWDKKTLLIRRRPFFFGERLLLGQKTLLIRRRLGECSNSTAKNFISRFDFGALGLAPLSENSFHATGKRSHLLIDFCVFSTKKAFSTHLM